MIEFDHLPGIIEALHAAVAEHVKTTAEAIAKDAKERAPKRTGDLADSIETEDGENDQDVDVVVGVAYGPDVEYGTRHMAAEPYLTPAADAKRSEFEALKELEEKLAQAK